MVKYLSISCLLLFLVACQPQNQKELIISDITTPSFQGGESHLSVNSNDELIMSWIEENEDSSFSLFMSTLKDEKFDEALEIASGKNWFVNWADFPSVVSYRGDPNRLAAHWLQKSATGTYDYDVMISQSKDGGKTWMEPFILHQDGIKAEHGFVSLSPKGRDRIMAVWLDGRNTKNEESGDKEVEEKNEHGHHGSMTLRSCEFDIDNKIYDSIELDHRVCECCQTDLAINNQGKAFIVYRDRSDTEVRDIFIKRKFGDQWLNSKPVWSEGWYVPGCPVNGPAIASSDSLVAVAWYSESAQTPKVQLAFSDDKGSEFSKPIIVDHGNPIGRVDIVFDDQKTVWLSWIEKEEEQASLRIAKFNQETKLEDHFVCEIDERRKSGFPILEKMNDDLYLSYTEVDKEKTRVKLKKINLGN